VRSQGVRDEENSQVMAGCSEGLAQLRAKFKVDFIGAECETTPF
jgi:hypothetical protein